MIKVILDNEILDIDESTLVTFKKAQQLNGVQDQYSYSNSFNGENSAKNRRLLGFNYLPNSKSRGMTIGYTVDVVMSGCIFLKKQKLKIQKETEKTIPMYLIFSDSLFIARAKEVLMSQIDTGADYDKTLAQFLDRNLNPAGSARTAPISAQDSSGLVVVEEIPILLNIKDFVIRIFDTMGYAYTGDILTDENISKYYMNSNVGVYGPNGVPMFDPSKSVYDFLIDFLKTFNGYIEVSDSSKLIGVYLWKNIETIKDRFVDYSDKFVSFTEYPAETGLAKINTMTYAGSPDFYNGFFNNNKSIVEKSQYLNSNFGAGSLRLFDDQELEEDGTLELRTTGEVSEPQTLNIFRFEENTTATAIYYGGMQYYYDLYKAVSPNILEIWQLFHQAYCNNIALPTTAQLNFRYDAIFISEFKMWQVFFIKQLSTYWLPLELNFNSKKDGVKVKCLMIEKTAIDVPLVNDYSMSIDFYGEGIINDVLILYSALNVSPPATMIVTGADLTKNNIFINGTQVLAFPTPIDVSAGFEVRIEGIEPVNVKSNSDILFQFVSEQGGVSRVAKLNVAHNGRANYVSEFRSNPDEVFHYIVTNFNDFERRLNYSGKITTPINIPDTLAPSVGDVGTDAEVLSQFQVLNFDKSGTVYVDLSIENLKIAVEGLTTTVRASMKLSAIIWKNGVQLPPIYTAGALQIGISTPPVLNEYTNVVASAIVNVIAGDVIAVEFKLVGDAFGLVPRLTGGAQVTNAIWKFRLTEQI